MYDVFAQCTSPCTSVVCTVSHSISATVCSRWRSYSGILVVCIAGVLDHLSNRSMTDAGPVELLDTAPSDDEEDGVVGAGTRGAETKIKGGLPGTAGKSKPIARTKCVRLSPTGR